MIRRIVVAFAALALLGAVACGGGEKKDDGAPTEQPTSAPVEEAPAEEAPAEEAPAEEAPAEEPAPEGGSTNGAEG